MSTPSFRPYLARAGARASAWFVLAVGGATLTGCAIHYYDRDTGTEHVWGLAHVRMRVPPAADDVQAVAHGNETLGFSAGTTAAGGHIGLGWHDERRIIITAEDAALSFAWPTSDMLDVRVGTRPPFLDPSARPVKEQP